MEEIRQEFSPKTKGWYVGLKFDDTPFIFYVNEPTDGQYPITIPWEFSKSPNRKYILDPKRWCVIEIDSADKFFDVWPSLKQIQPLEKCISSNVDLEMAYRKTLVGSNIEIDTDVYKILNTLHHVECWTIYILENEETYERKQIQLQGYNEWSYGGIDKIDVKILNT